jgi:hypothetical protein
MASFTGQTLAPSGSSSTESNTKWPQFSFILEYEEAGNGFQGLARAKNGKLDQLRVEY